jgi:hypothetical protein
LDLTTFLDLEKDVKNDVKNLFGIQFFYLLFSPSIGCGPKAPHVFLGFLPQRIWLGLAISLESIHGGTANGVFRSSKNVEIGGKNLSEKVLKPPNFSKLYPKHFPNKVLGSIGNKTCMGINHKYCDSDLFLRRHKDVAAAWCFQSIIDFPS